MHGKIFSGIVCLVAVVSAGCEKRAPARSTTSPIIDACTLLQKDEIETAQGSPVRDTKSSQKLDGDFRMSQCFYTTSESNKSVNLLVMQRNPSSKNKRTPRDFWEQTFSDRAEEEEREKGGKEGKGREEEKEGRPPDKVEGVGEAAYWASNRFGGILYVLKGEAFISLSLGGPDPEKAKIDKSKALAKKALERF